MESEPNISQSNSARDPVHRQRFPFRYPQLAQILGLTSYVLVPALAKELGLKDDPNMYYEKKMGSQKVYGYSQHALDKMKQSIADGIDMKAVYRKHNTASGKSAKAKQ